MIPLLALGLPGGALTAIMVAVFQFHDMEPGPLVFYNSPELIWVVFAAMFYANVSILFIGLIETKTILQLLRIPFHFLAPMILMLASIGSFIGRGLVLDVMVMFLAGMIGFYCGDQATQFRELSWASFLVKLVNRILRKACKWSIMIY